MNQMTLRLAIAFAVGILLSSTPASAQVPPHSGRGPNGAKGPYGAKSELPPAKRAANVQITKGPELESAKDGLAIIRWTSKNPGGSDEHFGVVHYGTDPKNLTEMAKSHIRLNRSHPETIFRVRVPDLKAGATYYYKVDSTQARGASDGVKSPVKRFTMPDEAQSENGAAPHRAAR